MVIVDASIVYKWLIDEEPSLTALSRTLRDQFLLHKEEIVAPDIIVYELGNILSRKTQLAKIEIDTVWESFCKINLPVLPPDFTFIKRCIDFSQIHSVSVYDAAYAVLAKEKNCILVTADAKFVKQVNLPYVKLLADYVT